MSSSIILSCLFRIELVGVGFGFWLTGRLGRSWVGAWHWWLGKLGCAWHGVWEWVVVVMLDDVVRGWNNWMCIQQGVTILLYMIKGLAFSICLFIYLRKSGNVFQHLNVRYLDPHCKA